MPGDPLIIALHVHHLLTPADLEDAIRHREYKRDELTAEINVLRALVGAWDEYKRVRDERDPPLATAERSRH